MFKVGKLVFLKDSFEGWNMVLFFFIFVVWLVDNKGGFFVKRIE